MIGTRYNSWTIIEDKPVVAKDRKFVYLCQCDCGTQEYKRIYTLEVGRSKQCMACRRKKQLVDYTGEKFGAWTVLGKTGHRKRSHDVYKCQCKCGFIKESLITDIKSCNKIGCKQCALKKLKKHEMSGENIYSVWVSMIQRCTNKLNYAFARYGGRGIKVCDRWRSSFENFLNDVGKRPEGYQLDRICNDGHYEPGNVRWASSKENNPYNKGDRYKDELPGQRFGKWTVLERLPNYKKSHRFYKCICECGTVRIISGAAFHRKIKPARQCRKCFLNSPKGSRWNPETTLSN